MHRKVALETLDTHAAEESPKVNAQEGRSASGVSTLRARHILVKDRGNEPIARSPKNNEPNDVH